MKIKSILLTLLGIGAFFVSAIAQQQPNNGGFENWDNVGSSSEEPTNWSGMMTGNLCGFCGLAASQRIFRDGSEVHGGTYSARIQSTSYAGNIVNGAMTTGQINAPSTTPADGYNKTIQSNASFNHPFTSYPDSVVFWAKYNITNNSDSARVSITLHASGYDVRDPSDAGSAPYVVARAVKNFQTNGTGTWKRISVPFNYASYPATTTAYMLATYTASKTAGSGSSSATLWVDDMQMIYNPPVTNFTASAATICAGQSINFTNTTTSGTTATYSWNFGDGNTSTSQNPSHVFNSAGTFTVQLTATNAGGSTSQTMSVTVNASPNVTTSGPSAVCLGSSVNISASGATSYTWDNGLGSGANQTVSPTVPTVYTVTGTASGCSSTATISIGVDTQSNPGTVNPLSTCISNTSVNLFTGINGEDPGGTWYDDNSTGALSGNIFNASLVSPGTYDFTYTHAANGACPAASTTTQVTVTNSVSAGSPSGANQVCGNDNAFDLFNTISGYSSGGVWSDDNSTGALNGNSFDATMVSPGSYSFTYYFLPGSCGTDSETISVTVLTPPTVDAGADQEICVGESATITAAGAVSYTWDNGVGAGMTQTVNPASTTTYTVTGLDNMGCADTDQMTVTVHNLPPVWAGSDQTVCEGAAVTLYGNGAASYTWDNGVSNGVTFAAEAGTTTYTVTGTDIYGCVNSDQVDITSLDLPAVSIDPFSTSVLCTYSDPISLPAGTPAGGFYSGAGVSGSNYDPSLVLPGIQTVSYVYTDSNGCINYASTTVEVSECLGLEEQILTGLNFYPNPADHVLHIETSSAEGNLTVTDATGRPVWTQSVHASEMEVNTQNWTPGTYFIRWNLQDGSSAGTHRFVVLH